MQAIQRATMLTRSRASYLMRSMSAAASSHDNGNAFEQQFARCMAPNGEALHRQLTDSSFGLATVASVPGSPKPADSSSGIAAGSDLEKNQNQPVKTRHGFFASSIHENRVKAVWTIAWSLVFMAICIMGLLSLYWGAFFNRNKYLSRTSFWIINMDNSDTAIVGEQFITIASKYAADAGSVRVEVRNSSEFGGSYDAVYDQVLDEKTWGVLIVHPNATQMLLSALANPSSAKDYDGTQLVELTYAFAREPQFYSSLSGWILNLAAVVTTEFSESVLSMVVADTNYSVASIVKDAPQLLSCPVSIAVNDLRPYNNSLYTAMMQGGLIYLIIISFFQFNFFQPVHMSLVPQLKCTHYVIYRIICTWLAYFFLSLFYCLISLAFQVDFTLKFGRAGFLVYWMICWLGMAAVGGACENAALIAIATYPSLVGIWLIFMVISNDSVSFYSISLQAGIYKYGYAFPLPHVRDAMKTIIFGLKNNMGLNVGVLLAWIAVNTLLAPFCLYFSSYRLQKQRAKTELTAAKRIAAEAEKQ